MTRRRPYKMRRRFYSSDPWRTTAYANSNARNRDAHGYADAGWDVEIWNDDGPKDALVTAPNALREQPPAPLVFACDQDKDGKPLATVRLLGDPGAVAAVVALRDDRDALRSRIVELEAARV